MRNHQDILQIYSRHKQANKLELQSAVEAVGGATVVPGSRQVGAPNSSAPGRPLHPSVCLCTCRLKCFLQPQHNAWLCRAAAKWLLLDASYRWPRRSVTPFSAIYAPPPSSHSNLPTPFPPLPPCPVATRGQSLSGEKGGA